MSLKNIHCTNFRNFTELKAEFSPFINVFFGKNASGKTSIIECIYLLGRGRSFRSSMLSSLIKQEKQTTSVFGQIAKTASADKPVGIVIEKSQARIKIEGTLQKSKKNLLNTLPVFLITPESHRLLLDGPDLRRKFLDWGVFHVEHLFSEDYANYQRALQQRNESLRYDRGVNTRGVQESLEKLMCTYADKIDKARKTFFLSFRKQFLHYSGALIDIETADIEYRRGWTNGEEFSAALSGTLLVDKKRGFTTVGPQRADLLIKASGKKAKDFVSRGQQKLLICAMYLALMSVITERTEKKPVFLIDDLASELDEKHRCRLFKLLEKLNAQVFITVVDKESVKKLDKKSSRMFHVEHNNLSEVV